jgi:hypothetical protein
MKANPTDARILCEIGRDIAEVQTRHDSSNLGFADEGIQPAGNLRQ